VLEAEHGSGYVARFGAGQADNAYAAATGRGGDGDDGVIEIHGSNKRLVPRPEKRYS
jgi:hypothetical protein